MYCIISEEVDWYGFVDIERPISFIPDDALEPGVAMEHPVRMTTISVALLRKRRKLSYLFEEILCIRNFKK